MLMLLLGLGLVRPLLRSATGAHRRACLARAAAGGAGDDGPQLLSQAETMGMLNDLQLSARTPLFTPPRGVFCTRSLDLKDIKCIGYDMDYTLIDYKMEVWEERAYHYSKEELRAKGFPVSGLRFNPELVCRGLIIDKEKGNLLKVDRFGYVRRAMHGTRMLSRTETFEEYARNQVDVDLRSDRWSFLNTLFSVSEGCLYAQLVDRLDSGQLLAECEEPFDASRCSNYAQLFRAVSRALFRAHVQSTLKSEVIGEIERFVNFDEGMVQALLDQRRAGKQLALITNSDWVYTRTLMEVAYERFLPEGMQWFQLFDLIICSACKPDFFSEARRPSYQVATPDGMLREVIRFERGGWYAGGNARMLEKVLGCRGEQVLYVGDHIFTDVNMAKRGLSWRTCMILQELEREVTGLAAGRVQTAQLRGLMARRDGYAALSNYLRAELLRRGADHLLSEQGSGRSEFLADFLATPEKGTGDSESEAEAEAAAAARVAAAAEGGGAGDTEWELRAAASVERLREAIRACNQRILPMVEAEGAHVNQYWGYTSRAGWADKSHLMRQIEKYADIYTSRVSNLLPYSPYMRFTTSPQSLSHEQPQKHWAVSDKSTEEIWPGTGFAVATMADEEIWSTPDQDELWSSL